MPPYFLSFRTALAVRNLLLGVFLQLVPAVPLKWFLIDTSPAAFGWSIASAMPPPSPQDPARKPNNRLCGDGSPTRPGRAKARLLLGRAPASAVPLKCFLFTPRASAAREDFTAQTVGYHPYGVRHDLSHRRLQTS